MHAGRLAEREGKISSLFECPTSLARARVFWRPLLSHIEIRDHSQSALCQRQNKKRDLRSVGANEQKSKLV